MQLQKTLRKSVEFVGKGLHSGCLVKLRIEPRKENYGIWFERSDVEGSAPFQAIHTNIVATKLCTQLANLGAPDISVSTVEHLLAAFSVLGIDNAHCYVSGPELPILDGSSQVFIDRFLNTGLVVQDFTRRVLKCKKAFSLSVGESTLLIEPSSDFALDIKIDFGSASFIGSQRVTLSSNDEQSMLGIMKARTFCHLKEVHALRQAGLCRGGSLENAVVVTENGVLNEDGLRDKHEFVMHKALDFIGDFYLFGAPVIGKFTLSRPGHSLHAEAMKMLSLDLKYYFDESPAKSCLESIAGAVAAVGGVPRRSVFA